MANGFGLRLVGRIGGGQPRVNRYYIPATDTSTLGENDVVMLPAAGSTALDPLNQFPVVTAFTTGKVPVGVVLGIRPIAALPYTAFKPASTAAYLEVCDDPDALYEVQEDAVGGACTVAQVGGLSNAALVITNATLATSGTMLDSSTASLTAISDVKIIGVRQDASNAAAQSGGAILLVRLLGPVQPGSALTSTKSEN